MDCENCKHSKELKPGTYETINGHLTIQRGKSFQCQLPSIKSMKFVDDEMVCSEYEEKES